MARKRVNKGNFDNKSHMQMAGLILSGFALAVIGSWLTFGASASTANLAITANDISATAAVKSQEKSGAKKGLYKYTMAADYSSFLTLNGQGIERLDEWYERYKGRKARLCVFARRITSSGLANMVLEFTYRTSGSGPSNPDPVYKLITVDDTSDYRKYCTNDFVLHHYYYPRSKRVVSLYFEGAFRSPVVDVTSFGFELRK